MREKPKNDDMFAGELFGVTRPVKRALEVDPLPNARELWRSIAKDDPMSVSRFYCSNCGHIIRITENAVRALSVQADVLMPTPLELPHTYFLVKQCLLCSDHYEAPKLREVPKE